MDEICRKILHFLLLKLSFILIIDYLIEYPQVTFDRNSLCISLRLQFKNSALTCIRIMIKASNYECREKGKNSEYKR